MSASRARLAWGVPFPRPTADGETQATYVWFDALPNYLTATGFPAEHVAFMTAYLDRSAGPFKKTVDSLAWGSYAWFAAEPEYLIVLSQAHGALKGRP